MNHDYFNGIPLSEVCQDMVDNSGKPLKAIAADMGKKYTTLRRELDQEDDGAKIGVDSLLPLMRACHADGSRLGQWPPKTPPAPLMWLAGKCGFRCVPIDAEPGHADVREELMDDYHALCQMQEAIRGGEAMPYEIVQLARKAQREIEETVEQYRREYVAKRGIE